MTREPAMCSLESTTRDCPRPRPAMRRIWLIAAALLALATPDVFGTAAGAAERPPVMGRNGGVSAGHPLTTAAALEIPGLGGARGRATRRALVIGGAVASA